jgi:hypothetical protein
MMNTVTSTEDTLLSNWVEVIKVKDGVVSLQKKIDRLFEIIKTGLKNSEWWTEEFAPPEYRNRALYFWKKSWYFGNNQHDTVQIGIENLSLDSLLSTTIARPIAYVWTQILGKNRQEKEEFQRLFSEHANELRVALKFQTVSVPEYALYYELPYTAIQWAKILRESRFVEIILMHCNILARFIEPVDRALETMRAKNSRNNIKVNCIAW